MCRVLVLLSLACVTRVSLAEVTIHLVPSADKTTSDVCVEGLSQEAIRALSSQTADRLSQFFKLFVHSESVAEASSLPAVLGDYSVEERKLLFRPRFALRLGQDYRAEFLSPLADQRVIHVQLSLPKPAPKPATRNVGIFPSATRLPQNLLKFYLHFSAPMAQGNVYRFIEISTVGGRRLEFPFLELAEELWDHSGKRLTLLLDPGRIKRGLVPREEDGAIFELGESYRLTVRSEWPDALGRPLEAVSIKEFTIVEEDFEQPNPDNWIIRLATINEYRVASNSIDEKDLSSSPCLQVDFPEPLDHALLGHCLELLDTRGQPVPGEIKIVDQERRWMFIPQSTMQAGEYTLKIDPLIEDLAGNSIARAFEVDLSKPDTNRPPIDSRLFSIP